MLNVFLALIATGFADEPFWRAKEKVYARVQNRDVIVSVRSVEKTGTQNKHELSMSGGGQVQAPCSYVFRVSQDFEPLAKASGYMDTVRYDEKDKTLLARISAYGFKAHVAIQLESQTPEGADPYLRYKVVKGPLNGMTGRFTFSPALTTSGAASNLKCDVGMTGEYGYDRFPIPELFLRFGMEVMFQRMASRMRTFAEGQYVQNR